MLHMSKYHILFYCCHITAVESSYLHLPHIWIVSVPKPMIKYYVANSEIAKGR